MKIQIAHLRIQGIDFAVFAADAVSHDQTSRRGVLGRLTARARANGLKIDKAALAFTESGRTTFFGTPDLVRYLSSRGVPGWTHTIDV